VLAGGDRGVVLGVGRLVEEPRAGAHLEEQDPEDEHVGGGAQALLLDVLRGAVAFAARRQHPLLGLLVPGGIEEVDRPVVAEQHVVGHEVAVHPRLGARPDAPRDPERDQIGELEVERLVALDLMGEERRQRLTGDAARSGESLAARLGHRLARRRGAEGCAARDLPLERARILIGLQHPHHPGARLGGMTAEEGFGPPTCADLRGDPERTELPRRREAARRTGYQARGPGHPSLEDNAFGAVQRGNGRPRTSPATPIRCMIRARVPGAGQASLDPAWLSAIYRDAGLSPADAADAAEATRRALVGRRRPKRTTPRTGDLRSWFNRDPFASFDRIVGTAAQRLPFYDADQKKLDPVAFTAILDEIGFASDVALAFAKVVVEIAEPGAFFQPIWTALGQVGAVDLVELAKLDWTVLRRPTDVTVTVATVEAMKKR
jgi:hypothetical protein